MTRKSPNHPVFSKTLLLEGLNVVYSPPCDLKCPPRPFDISFFFLHAEEEEPPVKFDTVDNGTVVRCVSKGWYMVPTVRWLNRREEDISENSTVEVLEQMKDGRHRVSSTLSGVKSHEIYRCLIRDVQKAKRPRTIYRRLSTGNRESH